MRSFREGIRPEVGAAGPASNYPNFWCEKSRVVDLCNKSPNSWWHVRLSFFYVMQYSATQVCFQWYYSSHRCSSWSTSYLSNRLAWGMCPQISRGIQRRYFSRPPCDNFATVSISPASKTTTVSTTKMMIVSVIWSHFRLRLRVIGALFPPTQNTCQKVRGQQAYRVYWLTMMSEAHEDRIINVSCS